MFDVHVSLDTSHQVRRFDRVVEVRGDQRLLPLIEPPVAVLEGRGTGPEFTEKFSPGRESCVAGEDTVGVTLFLGVPETEARVARGKHLNLQHCLLIPFSTKA